MKLLPRRHALPAAPLVLVLIAISCTGVDPGSGSSSGGAGSTSRFAPTPDGHITPSQSFGMGADGKAEVECGGEMPIEGHVFKLSSTNVN